LSPKLQGKLFIAAVALAIIIVVVALLPDPNRSRTFDGEIMDAQCAMAGSHDAMMKANGLTEPLQCTLFCARVQTPGGSFVLYDRASKTIYHLDDQDRVEPYAAGQVAITGSYNSATKTIHVTNIQALPQN
jgi:hypothetical protein